MIKVIIVDDHTIFREGMKLLLSTIPDVDFLGEAADGIEFMNIIDKTMPDVVLMDINMPKLDGIDATKLALEKYPDLKILILTMFGDEVYLEKAMEAGVKGFLKKNADMDEMEKAIRTVYKGSSYYAGDIVQLLANLYQNKNKNKQTDINSIQLSAREIEVLKGICNGKSNHEIGDELFISHRTVDGHRANLLAKAGCKNAASLVMWSIKHGYVNPE